MSPTGTPGDAQNKESRSAVEGRLSGPQAQGSSRTRWCPRFAVPIACQPGKTCFVQNYVDTDLGPAARDFSCGGATYDGHKGTDIRPLTTEEKAKSIAVMATAAGTIKGVRDGMPDVLVRERGATSVASRECGTAGECRCDDFAFYSGLSAGIAHKLLVDAVLAMQAAFCFVPVNGSMGRPSRRTSSEGGPCRSSRPSPARDWPRPDHRFSQPGCPRACGNTAFPSRRRGR